MILYLADRSMNILGVLDSSKGSIAEDKKTEEIATGTTRRSEITFSGKTAARQSSTRSSRRASIPRNTPLSFMRKRRAWS